MSDGRSALPQGWRELRLKFLACVQTGMAKGKDLAGTETVEVPYLRVANVQDGYLDLNDVATMAVPTADLDRYRLQIGDVLMNEGGDFDKLGRGHVWHGQIDPCIHQNHVFAVRPHGVTPEWLNAYTGSAPAQFYFMGRSKQSTNLASISSSNLMELPVPVPPVAVQHQLLAYLDRETARIDALIEKKTHFIELLREKQQALISSVVTRGLISGTRLRDSGVEFIGDMPEHYALTRLMHVTAFGRDIMYGIVLPGPDVETGVPIVKGGNVRPERLRLDELARTTPEIEAPYARARLRPSDIVYSIRGSIGDAELVPEELLDANITQDVARVSPGPSVSARWLLYVLKSDAVFGQLDRDVTGATIRGINIFSLKRVMIAVPPKDEQARMAEHLDRQLERLDRLVVATRRSIDLLKEHRAALITAAVTGQIDVRAEQPASTLEPA